MSTTPFTVFCKGRGFNQEEVLSEAVEVIVTVGQYASKTDLMLDVTCPYNTGSHGQRCKASHPDVDKVDDGVACCFSIDLPYASDNHARLRAECKDIN